MQLFYASPGGDKETRKNTVTSLSLSPLLCTSCMLPTRQKGCSPTCLSRFANQEESTSLQASVVTFHPTKYQKGFELGQKRIVGKICPMGELGERKVGETQRKCLSPPSSPFSSLVRQFSGHKDTWQRTVDCLAHM